MPSAGQRLGEYILEAKLGQGAFGEVWRACHHVWRNQLVAVKIPTDPNYVRQLQREGLTIHGLSHPSIVRAINFDPFADPPYLVIEYVPGVSLRTLIGRRITVDKATAILRQILEALDHAHRHGVVHRDVKPENVLIHVRARQDGLAAPGTVKLTDFGLGQGAVSTQSIMMSRAVSHTGTVSGTQLYMAPEQLKGQPVDGRADLYACGIILFEMLTGERPAGTELPSALNPAVPSHLDDAFRRSFTRLEWRFASARDFLDALGKPAVAQAISPAVAQPRRPVSVPPPLPMLQPPPPMTIPIGYAAPPFGHSVPTTRTDKQAGAGIMGILFGALGVHKFALGFHVAGACMLLFTVLAICLSNRKLAEEHGGSLEWWGFLIMGTIGFIEGIIYLTRSPQAFHETYIIRRRSWF